MNNKKELIGSLFGILVLTACVVFAGCSSSVDITTPSTDSRVSNPCALSGNAHSLMWYGMISIDPDSGTAELIPSRQAEVHFNVRKFAEEGPCTNCLKITAVEFYPDDILGVDIKVSHPFPGLDQFTGFDVRGIVIFNGSHVWPSHGLIMPDSSMGDGELLNADGYTRLYNPVEYPPGSTGVGLWEYSKGKLAPDVELTGSLNGYIAYMRDEPRRIFQTSQTETRTYMIQKPDGPFLFGYALDCSWDLPDPELTGDPEIIDVPDDFSISANCPEAYMLSTSATEGLNDEGTGIAQILLDVYDWQGNGSDADVHVECPDIFDGLGTMNYEQSGPDYDRFIIDVTNENMVPVGNYPYLISASDVEPGAVDAMRIAYMTGSIEVTVVMVEFFDPVALATADPLSAAPLEFVQFNDDGSYDPDGGDIVLYEWDWDNDGVYDQEGESQQHAWEEEGTYLVQFRVTDDEGATDELDEPLEITIVDDTIPQPMQIATLPGFNSPYCARVDTVDNTCWVDCTQAAPILDFGFYKIDNGENVEKVFEKIGAGFTGMPGLFGLDPGGRKITAPDMLGVWQTGGPVDIWDLDGGDDLKAYIPIEEEDEVAFLNDAESFGTTHRAFVAEFFTNKLVVWDYNVEPEVFDFYDTALNPSYLDADYENYRLFCYCAGDDTTWPSVQVWDLNTITVTAEFNAMQTDSPFMSDLDYDPEHHYILFGSSTDSFEVWDSETFTHIQTLQTGMGEVQGIDHMGNGIYVSSTSTDGGHLLVYNATTFELVWDVPCGTDPRIVACNSNTGKIYVPDMTEGTVMVFIG